jgi:hypothetical protein
MSASDNSRHHRDRNGSRNQNELEGLGLHTYSFDVETLVCSVSMQKALGVTDNVP